MNTKIKRAIQDYRINLDSTSRMTDDEIEMYWYYNFEMHGEYVTLEDVTKTIRDVEDSLFYDGWETPEVVR